MEISIRVLIRSLPIRLDQFSWGYISLIALYSMVNERYAQAALNAAFRTHTCISYTLIVDIFIIAFKLIYPSPLMLSLITYMYKYSMASNKINHVNEIPTKRFKPLLYKSINDYI